MTERVSAILKLRVMVVTPASSHTTSRTKRLSWRSIHHQWLSANSLASNWKFLDSYLIEKWFIMVHRKMSGIGKFVTLIASMPRRQVKYSWVSGLTSHSLIWKLCVQPNPTLHSQSLQGPRCLRSGQSIVFASCQRRTGGSAAILCEAKDLKKHGNHNGLAVLGIVNYCLTINASC